MSYTLGLGSWLWLLVVPPNCLIFHEKTAPEIIEKMFGKHGFAIFSNKLSRGYPKIEYCVQYREIGHGFRLPADGAARHQLLFQALRTASTS